MRVITCLVRPVQGKKRLQQYVDYYLCESIEEAIAHFGTTQTLDFINRAHRIDEMRKAAAERKAK